MWLSQVKMEDFQQICRNFFCTLSESNTDQQLFLSEILESFKAFCAEILLSFHVSVGSKDIANVQDLISKDIIEICRLRKEELEENIKSYLKTLQEKEEDRLFSLHRRIALLLSSLTISKTQALRLKIKVAQEQALSWEPKEQEMMDLTEFFRMITKINQEVIKCCPAESTLNIRQEMKEHQRAYFHWEDMREVREINKRVLAMIITCYVGHEGMEDKHGLRRLLQTCIDFLQTKNGEFWRNALITIYDENDNMINIGSGRMKHQFICQMENGAPNIFNKMLTSDQNKINGHSVLQYLKSTFLK